MRKRGTAGLAGAAQTARRAVSAAEGRSSGKAAGAAPHGPAKSKSPRSMAERGRKILFTFWD